ncbi:MAG: hypothetical protein V3U76_13375 [Granulosicoccus sp.]
MLLPYNYLQSHWLGHHSLAKSFWINLLAIRVLVFIGQEALLPATGHDYSDKVLRVVTLLVLVHGILFVWQIVGVVRSADRWLSVRGSQATVWGVQLSVVVLLWLSASYVLQGWQATLSTETGRELVKRMDEKRISQYSLLLNPLAKRLEINGLLTRGITRHVTELLGASNSINQVVLHSRGGNIHEARGLAKLFRDHKLSTHVEAECASACTIAFIGGSPRTLRQGARLGFHQYRVDAAYAVPVADAEAEQLRDQSLFIDAGVSTDFVENMFRQRVPGMWWPKSDELLHSAVVHRITGR